MRGSAHQLCPDVSGPRLLATDRTCSTVVDARSQRRQTLSSRVMCPSVTVRRPDACAARASRKPSTFSGSRMQRDNPERPIPARSQSDRETDEPIPGAYRRDSPQALAPRHPGGWRVARASLRRLAQLFRRHGVIPVHTRFPSQAATPVDASAAPTVPAAPSRLEEDGAHDRDTLAPCLDPPPVARPAVHRQEPEVGAGRISVHVRICAGGAQQCAFLRRLGRGPLQRSVLPGQRKVGERSMT